MAASSRFATVSEDDFCVEMFFFPLFFEIITCVFILKQLFLISMSPEENKTSFSVTKANCRLEDTIQFSAPLRRGKPYSHGIN